jgi:hypothetical protein
MNDLIERAESGRLSPEEFTHERHVELAFRYLLAHPLGEATQRIERAIREVARTAGKPDKYHATITWFFAAIIAERLAESGERDWPRFRCANPDLFEPGLLERYYSAEVLGSERARLQFIMPRR